MIHQPRQTKLTLDVTLKRGREQIRRKVTVNYPKKLYPFELKEEITGFITGFKTMVAVIGLAQKVLQKVEKARRRVRPDRTVALRKRRERQRRVDRFLRPASKLKR